MSTVRGRRRFGRTADPIPEKAAEPAAPDDFAAQAGALRQEAADARSRAAEARAEAEARLSDARQQAAQIMQAAEAAARIITAGASTADSAARRLEEQAAPYAHADRCQGQLAEAQEAADALAAERDDLTGQVAGLSERAGRYDAERDELERRRADALTRFDEHEAGELHRAIESKIALLDEAERQREPLRARLAAIGDPAGRGELAAALGVVSARQAELRRALNVIDPQRPEAKMDDLLAIVEANRERIAEESAQASAWPRTLISQR